MDARTLKNITKEANEKASCPSQESAIIKIALEMYRLGVPSTRCVNVAVRVYKMLSNSTSTHVDLPGNCGSYAHAEQCLRLWDDKEAQDTVKRATQSFIARSAN